MLKHPARMLVQGKVRVMKENAHATQDSQDWIVQPFKQMALQQHQQRQQPHNQLLLNLLHQLRLLQPSHNALTGIHMLTIRGTVRSVAILRINAAMQDKLKLQEDVHALQGPGLTKTNRGAIIDEIIVHA